jgi:hypothetical protein
MSERDLAHSGMSSTFFMLMFTEFILHLHIPSMLSAHIRLDSQLVSYVLFFSCSVLPVSAFIDSATTSYIFRHEQYAAVID